MPGARGQAWARAGIAAVSVYGSERKEWLGIPCSSTKANSQASEPQAAIVGL